MHQSVGGALQERSRTEFLNSSFEKQENIALYFWELATRLVLGCYKKHQEEGQRSYFLEQCPAHGLSITAK